MSSMCEHISKTNWHLKNHITKVHEKKKAHFCNPCAKPFSEKCDWARHNKRFHSQGQTLKCEVCNKIFISKDILKKHFQDHHEENTCKICSKLFPTSECTFEHVEETSKMEKQKIENMFANFAQNGF